MNMETSNLIRSITRRELIPSRKDVKSFMKMMTLLIVFALVTCNFTLEQSLLTRHLSSSDTEPMRDAQMFQIALTGVPHRVPTVIEAMYLESVLLDYLLPVLAAKDVKIYDIRVRTDKTIHYQRNLNERFTVAGEKYKSNGNMEIDHATMSRVNQKNRRVLGSGGDGEINVDGNANPVIHQLSLMVVIKGMYRPSLEIDYDSLVMTAINEGQTEIQQKLVNPGVSTNDAPESAYFKDVQFIVCGGVGPRDSEPVLEMSDVKSSTDEDSPSTATPQDQKHHQHQNQKDEDGSSSTMSQHHQQHHPTDGKEDVYLAEDQNEEEYPSDTQSEHDFWAEGKSGGEYDAGMNQRDPNSLRQSNTHTKDIDTNTNSKNETTAHNSHGLPKHKYYDVKNDEYSAFNAQAIELRLVSGFIFVALCMSICMMHLLRVIVKKNEDRRRRIVLAKKAYGGPLKESNLGQSFYKNNKYTGTMDTGAGL